MEFIGSVKNFKKILEKFKNDDEFYFKIEDKKKSIKKVVQTINTYK